MGEPDDEPDPTLWRSRGGKPTLVDQLGQSRLRERAEQRIDKLLHNPHGLPNGKAKRSQLSAIAKEQLKSALMEAVGYASTWTDTRGTGTLPNRVRGRGRPPDNAIFVFIDDVMRACRGAGLTSGLRYVPGAQSVPVRIFIELAPLLWPVGKDPRRFFQRWQRNRRNLARS
jgi:hypothetical protein